MPESSLPASASARIGAPNLRRGGRRGILPRMGAFAEQVFHIVCQVPRGKVTTYGQVARLMGRPQSARYVGFALRGNPSPGSGANDVPCHRVVFKDGSLCKGYAFGGPGVQKERLVSEGVRFIDDTHVDLDTCLWDGIGANAFASAGGDERIGPPPDFDWERELEG